MWLWGEPKRLRPLDVIGAVCWTTIITAALLVLLAFVGEACWGVS